MNFHQFKDGFFFSCHTNLDLILHLLGHGELTRSNTLISFAIKLSKWIEENSNVCRDFRFVSQMSYLPYPYSRDTLRKEY